MPVISIDALAKGLKGSFQPLIHSRIWNGAGMSRRVWRHLFDTDAPAAELGSPAVTIPWVSVLRLGTWDDE